MVNYDIKPGNMQKKDADKAVFKEVADFTRLPEIQKAVESAAVFIAKQQTHPAQSDAQISSAGNENSDNKNPLTKPTEAPLPPGLVSSIEQSYYHNPEKLKLAATQYALLILEEEKLKKSFEENKPGGFGNAEKTAPAVAGTPSEVPAKTLEEMVDLITKVEAYTYAKGIDEGDDAKQASVNPDQYKNELRNSLLNNPQTAELIKELPRAVHMSKLSAGPAGR